MDTKYVLTTLLCMVLAPNLCSSLGELFLGEMDVKAAIQRPEAPVRRVRLENEENSVATFVGGGGERMEWSWKELCEAGRRSSRLWTGEEDFYSKCEAEDSSEMLFLIRKAVAANPVASRGASG